MRRAIFAAVAVLSLGGITTGVLVANAQPAPPAPGMDGPPPPRPNWMGWMRHGQDRGDRVRLPPRTFALIYPQQDRQLTPPDVQKIAEAFLLWNGNHSWKVVDVAPVPDGAIGFAFATQDGGVIARFTLDPHTARVTRSS
jgi:hypothetical protein